MAHDWLGTFNKSQLDRFLAFARSQLPLVDARIQHLSAEQARLGVVVFKFDQGVPVGFAADPADSVLGKLLAAYEVLGGNPFHDLRVRSRSQPIFLVRGSETAPASYMSSGDVVGARGLADAPSAVLVSRARQWIEDTLHGRFGRLERKIRRTLDYSDELQAEITILGRMKLVAEIDGSLESIATQLQQLIDDPNYRAIFDDRGADPFGFTSYAPFSSYDAVQSDDPNMVRPGAEVPQRQNSGFVGPGEKA